jgi:hypothetical protein
MEQWQFTQNSGRLWCWARVDDRGRPVLEGTNGFASRADCIVDAMRHGYLSAPTAPNLTTHPAYSFRIRT